MKYLLHAAVKSNDIEAVLKMWGEDRRAIKELFAITWDVIDTINKKSCYRSK